MFGLGYQEIFLVLVVAVIVFGKNLPDVSRSIGKGLRELQRGFHDLKNDVDIDRRDFQEALPHEPGPDDEDFQPTQDGWAEAEDRAAMDCEEWNLSHPDEEDPEAPEPAAAGDPAGEESVDTPEPTETDPQGGEEETEPETKGPTSGPV